MAAEKDKTSEPLVSRMSSIAMDISALPKDSTPADLANAVSQIAECEKLLRKVKVAWTAALVFHARQRPLV